MKKNWTERGHERRAPPRSPTELVSLLNVYLFVGLWITSDQTSYILTGWSKGALGTRAPGPISFIFMQFSAKILPNNRILPQIQGLAPSSAWEILDPPLTLLLNSIAQVDVCPWGVCLGDVCPGGVCLGGVSSQGGPPRGCLPRGCLPKGGLPRGCLPTGVSAQRECLLRGVSARHSPVNRITTTLRTVNIILAQGEAIYSPSISWIWPRIIAPDVFPLKVLSHLRFITRGLLRELLSPCNHQNMDTQPIIELFSPCKSWANSKCESAYFIQYNPLFSE